MVKDSPGLDLAFEALADPTRRAIVELLSRRPCRVGDLAEPFAMSLPAISKHVSTLCRAGLVRKRRVGREQWCTLDPGLLRQVRRWVDRRTTEWETRLSRLDRHLQEEP